MHANLSFDVFPKCTVVPQKMRARANYAIGAFDENDQPIRSSLLFRYVRGVEKQIGFPGKLSPRRDHIPGSAIYMGILFNHHFGHFLLEGLSRAWFAKTRPDLPLVWTFREQDAKIADGEPGYTPWQSEILALLGIQNPALFVATSTVFDELIIPEPGCRIQDYLHPDHRDFLAVVEHKPEAGRRTWLSRAQLEHEKSNRSAILLDKRLAQAGWDVIHPERLPFAEQIRILAASERIAGEQGSALHTVVLLRNPERLTIDIFSRNPGGHKKETYETIAALKNIKQTTHFCDFEHVIGRRERAFFDKVGENSFKYLDLLGEPRVNATPSVTEPKAAKERATPSRLMELAKINQAKTYLEVGVATGKTILNVDLPVKHGVDPEFRFDTREFESNDVRFFEMTSDLFFTTFARREVKYDLIFLDGLHTFEQTFRDFCSSQAHAHDRTLWLIDDVYPSDVFSAHPEQKLAKKYRAQHGSPGKAWHGDVYKLLFVIHDYFPNLSYRTVIGRGNPQAVVIRRPRTDFAPKFGGLEAISRLTYYDFLEQQEALNLASNKEMLAWAAS